MAPKRNFKSKRERSGRGRTREREVFDIESWVPKTTLGKKVKSKEFTNLGQVLNAGKIMESEIVDAMLPNLSTEFISIGQMKGKFGGGKRRIFRQTQKKTKEGNKPIFSTAAVVGNGDGYIGLGVGRSKETMPSKAKSLRNAKLNMIQIARGCGSWQCSCGEPHTVPFKTSGRAGSVRLSLLPAPKGTGLAVEDELKKMLSLAGIKDVWSQVDGQTRQKINLLYACFEALKKAAEAKTKTGQKIIRGAQHEVKDTKEKSE